MTRYPFFKEAFLSLIFLWVAHLLALQFFLYWAYWWFDIVMHFWGGVVVALGSAWILRQRKIIPMLAITLCIAIVWEIFEYKTGIAVSGSENYLMDTATDITMAVLGTSLVYKYIFIKEKNV